MSESKPRTLLFSVTRKDLEFQYFRASGPGGQHRNKVETGVRIKHPDSGAVAQASEHKSRERNQREAFLRLTNTREFKTWQKMKAARMLGQPTPEEVVDQTMKPSNLRVEGRDENGRWALLEDEDNG